MTRLLRRLRGEEEGYALLTVLGVGIVLLAMVAAALSVSSSGYVKAKTDDDANAALAAAYAGVEEYQSRLANDSRYFMYGNPSAAFSASSAATVSLPTGALENPAFGVGAAGTWATIPGGTSAYRYEIDNSDYDATGILHLRVTGRAGDSTRTVVTDLKQDGFLDFLYFTDFEIQDPVFSGQTSCANKYAWARSSNCQIIQFGAMDVINGPLHSNDQMQICGAKFKGAVTTASTMSPNWSRPSGCASPTWSVGAGPVSSSTIGMPPTNGDLKKETRTDLADVPRPGCLYTGPTTITFNAGGTMTVVSPWTKRTNVAATAAGSSNPAQCGQPGTGTGQLGHKNGATIPVLPSNLAYVQNVPVSSADPNYWASGVRPADVTCTGTSDFPGWSFHDTRYPATDETQPNGTNAANPAYQCTYGDVFVSGVVNGAITVASENFVYITGNITYADPQDDILGLVGNNAVQVWNPRKASGLVHTTLHRTVQAAILSVAHTFTVQNYAQAPARGTLTVLGAIAQKYRGPVATTSGGSLVSGYAKNYVYDTRLRYTAPPKFLTPTSTTYGVTQVASVRSAFDAKGAAS